MEETKKCPKCGGEMEGGSVVTNGFMVKARWHGRQLPKYFNKCPQVVSYKCSKCGYLENYVE